MSRRVDLRRRAAERSRQRRAQTGLAVPKPPSSQTFGVVAATWIGPGGKPMMRVDLGGGSGNGTRS